MFNYIRKIAKAATTFDFDFNPRVVQFVMHYIKGSQETMTLTDREKLATKYQILMSMCRQQGTNKYDDSKSTIEFGDTWIGENAYCVDMVEQQDEDLYSDYLAYAYLKSITMGVVGGFDYTISPNMVAMCKDTWDFNAGFTSELSLNIPRKLYKAFQCLTRKLNLEWYTIELENGDYNVTTQEQNLTALNKTHAFDTIWDIDFVGESCCIDKQEYMEYLHSMYLDVINWN